MNIDEIERQIEVKREEISTWNDFKEKYKPLWNEWHSKMVKACPKPRSKYKTKKES